MSIAVPALPNYAGANRRIIQAQGRFKRLGDRVGTTGRAVDLAFGDKCRQAEVVVPEIKGVIIRRPRLQVAAVQKIHPVRAGDSNFHTSE